MTSQGIPLNELQSVLNSLPDEVLSPSAAAKIGRNMCHVVGELVAFGFAKEHGIALVFIGAGTLAPHDGISVPTKFRTVQ